jgi:hypothetical protein
MSTSRTSSISTLPLKSQPQKSTKRKQRAIPPQALEHLLSQLLSFQDSRLEASIRGRFCYVDYAGGPLCRLGYRGQLDEWDFAIYKYSTQRYGELELAPSCDSVFNCVDLALHAYNFR